jgi:N4-gp56 family major capsid protein
MLQDRNVPNFVHEQFGLAKEIPSRGGNNISIRQFTRPAASTTALVEGTPPSNTNVTVAQTIISVAQYGAYMLGSDVVETQAIDPQLAEWTQVFTELKNDTRDRVIRNAINAGTTVNYTNGATVRSGLASGSAYNIAWADIRAARRSLRSNDAPYYSDNRYFAIIHPDVSRNLFADTTVVNAAQYAGPRTGDNPLFTGQLPDLMGLRFFETTNASTLSGLGQSAGFVYSTLVGGKGAYAVTSYSADSDAIIFHAAGSAGALDPLNQFWSLGFKTAVGAGIIDQNRMVRIESNG